MTVKVTTCSYYKHSNIRGFGLICFGFEQKVEIKVDINCEKCRYDIMQTVTELEGMLLTKKTEKRCYLIRGYMRDVLK